ncbi:uncharacterized protein PFL1_05809 [Pseudozyma flocculosa PF-1]|uniref:Related to integral peroxisomal membrane protein n=2 Tax=Pseudozyma flocculosa TaxID=84751 RepID=A0A5C3F4C0_9BASI|nr:uncharacterized protein PFL1_05809 [Pseudozyma flocculosa PF-1]EPQ26487.1 hypothetical protein PFL1_05809 [Pseudozyma flocculosa PF-1]SPO38527.1 related to integral peroxisomal membrane protein [Pseudozyma flocculosa]
MAAFEHPLTDPYLSLIHQSRIGASASRPQRSQPSPMASDSAAAAVGPSPRRPSDSNPGAALLSSSAQTPSTSVAASASLAASFEPLSSAEVLERVPSSVVRVLAALGPAISLTNRFIRLATWTGGPGSGGSSMLLLVGWWLVCAFGYEVLRYAPQALVLAYIAYTWTRKQLGAARPSKGARRIYDRHDVVSAARINAILLELSELADFFSVARRSVLVPTIQLLSWDPSPNNTKAVAAFLVLTWPLWLLAFLPWDDLKLPRLLLPVSGSAILGFLAAAAAGARDFALRLMGSDRAAALSHQLDPLLASWDRLAGVVHRTPLPTVYRAVLSTLGLLRLDRCTDFSVRLLPPYPIAALSVRSLMFLGGTLALTWCSPWCGLIRQAVWKSATIRRAARGIGRILSGQRPFRDAWGRGKLDDDDLARDAVSEDSLLRSSAIPADVAKKGPQQAVEAQKAAAVSPQEETGFTRHEDVIYQFSIFENQRWWVGLDWTAALLPQERPSWSDESNNPVSPPSSFSLPPARITLTPSPTAANPKAFQRRTVKWQWLDPEWTVAGISHSSFPSTTSAAFKGSAKEAAIASAKSTGDAEAIAAAKQGYIGDALSRIRSARSLPSSPASSSEKAGSSAAATLTSSGGPLAFEEDEDWDVDADGWQYGDNAWDKMSKKAGLGRYTRRRKWVRRAVLIELVERGVDGPATPGGDKASAKKAVDGSSPVVRPSNGSQTTAAGAKGEEAHGVSDRADVASPTAASAGLSVDVDKAASSSSAAASPDVAALGDIPSPASPGSPTAGRADLKSRLAKAAHS